MDRGLITLISDHCLQLKFKSVTDQDNKRIDIILSEENLSKAIGRRGQNVRLASKLTNYEIDILTDKETQKEGRPNSKREQKH